MKYLRYATFGFKDIVIRKSEYVAETQFLWVSYFDFKVCLTFCFVRYDLFDTNRHGTRCAGQIAAVANNSFCTVGIAFNARIGGVKMLDGTITGKQVHNKI